ncbi:MAG: tripartite tricarboxylate transporter substrate binding protein [Betaproteobacteria bacterium]|nr:tripartite tricarboxylate transporter substrate binding protein [Betaproteobacteria bacterium]
MKRIFSALALCAIAGSACAQAWPAKPIRLIVPFPPAGGTDIVARTVAPHLAAGLGQPIVIDNRPGAGGTIGSEMGARAPNDGYTLLMATTSTHAVAPNLNPKLSYDPLRDFAPVSNVNSGPLLLVITAGLPVKSVRELIAHAKANPGKLTFASSGAGTVYHLTGEMFKTMTGTNMVHIPYKGSAQAFPDLISGQVSLMFDLTTSVMPLVKSGKLRALAVTSTSRNASVSDLPTVIEAGVPGFESTLWIGLFAPAGTPRDIVMRLNAEVARVLARGDVRDTFAQQGADTAAGSPEQFAAQIRADLAVWGKVIRDGGVKLE